MKKLTLARSSAVLLCLGIGVAGSEALAQYAPTSRAPDTVRAQLEAQQKAAAQTAQAYRDMDNATLLTKLMEQSAAKREPFNSPAYRELQGRHDVNSASLVSSVRQTDNGNALLPLLLLRKLDEKTYLALPANLRATVLTDALRGAVMFSMQLRGADFRGRKVAINVPGAFPEFLLTLILDKYGMTVKDVDETTLGFPQQIIALQNKAIDVAIPPEPFAATAIGQGSGALIVPEEAVGSGEITTMVFFSGRFLRERPDVGKRFLRAIVRAARETQGNYNKNPELGALLAHATMLKPEAVEKSVATAFDRDLDIAKFEASVRHQETVYMKIGRLDYATPLPMDRMVDASLVHQAAASMN